MSVMDIALRILCSIVVGGIIGFERERINRPAGLRTHILVCIGAAVISIIQSESIELTKAMIVANPDLADVFKSDIGRMGAQVVTGVGFLGAGTIVKEKGAVKGLTTAASIWIVACIGLAIGMGLYLVTLISVIGVILAIVFFKWVEIKYIDKKYSLILDISFRYDERFMQNLNDYFYLKNIEVNSIEYFDNRNINESELNRMQISLDVLKHLKATKILQDISAKFGVSRISVIN